MPKGKIQLPVSRKMVNSRSKFKLGGRKSVTSALRLSTPELLERVQKAQRNRDKRKIKQVLNARGIIDIAGAIAAGQPAEEVTE